MTDDELKAIKARHAEAETLPRDYWNPSGLHAHYDREQLLDEVERLHVTAPDSVSESQRECCEARVRYYAQTLWYAVKAKKLNESAVEGLVRSYLQQNAFYPEWREELLQLAMEDGR